MISFAVAATYKPRFNCGTNDVRRYGNGGGLGSAHGIMKRIASSRGLQSKAQAREPAKRQWMRHGSITKGPSVLSDADKDNFGLGTTVEDGRVFRQKFSVRSYEIGADVNETVETLMNHLQETALNHVRHVGLQSDGFGSTPEMKKKNLFWVVTKMQLVAIRYPTWGDEILVDTWVAASGKNGMRRDWMISDCKTRQIIIRASSIWVMMNKITRKLSKFHDEIRAEIERYFVDTPPLIEEDNIILPKLDESTADLVRNGLTGAPQQVLENYELASMTLEYRRECKLDSVLQLLTSSVDNGNGGSDEPNHVDFQHLLRLEGGGGEIVKGRTQWRPKSANLSQGHLTHVPD